MVPGGALVLVGGSPCWQHQDQERSAELKLVLAESGALHSAHPAPPASQASLPEQCMASVDAPLAPLECNVVVESLSGDHQWVCNTQHYCNCSRSLTKYSIVQPYEQINLHLMDLCGPKNVHTGVA